MGETVRFDILLISSDFYLEDNWKEAAYAWVFVVKSGGMRGSIYFFTKMFLMMLPADALKAYHASTKMEFIWRGKKYVFPYFSIHAVFI